MVSKNHLIATLVLTVSFVANLTVGASSENDNSEKMYEETVVLQTKMGALRGHKEVVDFRTSYFAFKGIRYAKSPTKEKRFQVRP